MDSEHESKLVSLISEIMSFKDSTDPMDSESKFLSLIIQIVSLISTMDLDLDLQKKPESELISLTTQIISVIRSLDLDSQPKPLSKLISLISQKISPEDSTDSDSEFMSLVTETLSLEPEPELISLIHQVLSLVNSMKLISLCPQVQVYLEEGILFVDEEVLTSSNDKRNCLPINWDIYELTGEEATHFLCRGCNGHNHEEYNKAPVEVKNILHPIHSLQLVSWKYKHYNRQCYCCDEDLIEIFYCCVACDFAMNVACVERPPILSIDHPKWHDHTLALFPRQASLTCNICGLADTSSPIYMCPPCNFVLHLSCIHFPRVIKILRHPHRMSFTPYFDQGDLSCDICRKMMDNNYGGYSCIKKDGCSYAAHSRCATQSNLWDGIELEGMSEETEEEEEEEEEADQFTRINDGIIQHFSHQHNLRLGENTGRDYDENRQCQACIMPIYNGNFYSCMECDFILHETCANFSRKINSLLHPHMLTLVTEHVVGRETKNFCLACPRMMTAGFFYECGELGCHFQLHVQCATISEPLRHESHDHPLFLTSKPGELRVCSVCKESRPAYSQTFNCIKKCYFSLCFACATLPHRVRYTDDKHILTLSYGEKTSTKTIWCEECEREICKGEPFYMCTSYCCVTLHIECMLGSDLYMKPGSSWFYNGRKVDVLHNDHQISRPICSFCETRCRQKIFYQCFGLIFCTTSCIGHGMASRDEQIA